jgi:hypothetical protein
MPTLGDVTVQEASPCASISIFLLLPISQNLIFSSDNERNMAALHYLICPLQNLADDELAQSSYVFTSVSLRAVLVLLIHDLYMGIRRRLLSLSLPTRIAMHIRSFGFIEPEDAYARLLVHPHTQYCLSVLPLSSCCLNSIVP